ncbi:MAG: hypothetical protein GX481_08145 [Atopobium sp.]|nr:hypothetical protein [Atopobium sp.]
MSKKIDLIGQRFGRLTVLKEAKKINGRTAWLCKCDCGNFTTVQTSHLTSGATKSCGCLHRERASKANKTHGFTHTSLHNRWKAIIQRCDNPNNRSYKNYGGRGLSYCDEWKDFESFMKWSIANGYEPSKQLDRIDNNLGYSPENCRWVKPIINNHNRRNTVHVNGMTLRDISEKYQIKYQTIHSRYYEAKKKGITPTLQMLTLR